MTDSSRRSPRRLRPLLPRSGIIGVQATEVAREDREHRPPHEVLGSRMVEIPLDEAIDVWLPVELRQIGERYGSVVLVDRHAGPWRYPAALFRVRDPLGAGVDGEVSLYEATGDQTQVGFTVFLAAIVPGAVPKRVHLWGADLRAEHGQIEVLQDATWTPAVKAGPALGPGIDHLVSGTFMYRRWQNPLRRHPGPRYSTAS